MNTATNSEQLSTLLTRRSFIAGLGVVGLTLATTSLVGCSGSSSTSGSTSGTSGKNYGCIKVGTNPGTGNIFGYIAVDKGFDSDEGYTTEFSDFDNSTDALNALQAGKIDVGVNFGTAAPLTFVTKGADFVIFGGYVSGGMPVYAQQDFVYNGPESFKGKTVGTARMYTPDIIWRGAMKDAGIDLDNDLKIVEFKKPSEVLAAVIAGQVDVGVATNSTYIGAMQAGLKVLCWTNDLDPTAVCCRQVADASWLSENPDRAIAYLKSLIRAEQVLEEDSDFAVTSFASHTNIDEDAARQLLFETHQELWVDPKSNGVEKMWQELKDLNYIDAGDINVTDHINIDLYQRALNELREEHPEMSEYLDTLQTRYDSYNSNLLNA
ncbi:MAG: ABC transporter substrate-binding protein [Eggerthellaceae bacterium]|jgi:NitT/TauT family transport system substrate-binding protein|nr:ABC transporter substrate-binding protein [Eggerthellaceae bacterium]